MTPDELDILIAAAMLEAYRENYADLLLHAASVPTKAPYLELGFMAEYYIPNSVLPAGPQLIVVCAWYSTKLRGFHFLTCEDGDRKIKVDLL